MQDSLPQKTIGDHVHFLARVGISTIPVIGGPAKELFNHLIAPPLERRRVEWLNSVAERLAALENEKRLKIGDLAANDEFISVVIQATTAAIRNHEQKKLDALRNAVLNTALGRSPKDIKSAMFLTFVDQFTVWHLQVLTELSHLDASKNGHSPGPKTDIDGITDLASKRIPELREQMELAASIVEDLCRKGLLFWNRGQGVAYIQRGATQLTLLGMEFLKYVTSP